MQIVSPCHENFNKMAKQDNGRYCKSCEKIVVDFTQMNQVQLLEYFEKHKNENICGRAKSIQLGKENRYESFLFNCRQFINNKINITPLRLTLLGAISGLLTLTTSCMGKMMPPSEKYSPLTKDTLKDQQRSVPDKRK